MKTLVFFLEELSAKEMLAGILPRIVPKTVQIRYVVFEGKRDLIDKLKWKLQGWRMPDCRFVVMCDQDSGDCGSIKAELAQLCTEAGKRGILVRIACHELESFYLGDLLAVEKGLGSKGLSVKQEKRKFRNPDAVRYPSTELFRLTRNMYDKVSGSRAIAPHLRLKCNRSASFRVLLSGINRLLET